MRSPSDERLVKRAAAGDEHAFAQLYERYAGRLLSFCRYLLGSREEAQDAVQQTFMRAHRAIVDGKPPKELRPWLYTVARNRCRSMLALRRERELPVEQLDDAAALDGLADVVQRREDLRALVRDLDRLPDDQRAALVLFELGDLSQRDIAGVLEVREAKVKALVHQARAHLIAERAARERSCEDVRAELAVARGAALRRGPLRRHVRSCPACRAWQADVGRQRAALGAVLPVALISSRDAALTALGVGAGSAGVGAAAGVGGVAGAGLATKAIAVVAALGVGAAGTEVAVRTAHDPARGHRAAQTTPEAARPAPAPPRPAPTQTTALSRPVSTSKTKVAHAQAVHAAIVGRKQRHQAAQGAHHAAIVLRHRLHRAVQQAKQDARRAAKAARPTHAAKVKPVHKAAPAKGSPAVVHRKHKAAVTTGTQTTPAPNGKAKGLGKQLDE